MVRQWFYILAAVLLVSTLLLSVVWPSALWSLLVILPLTLLGLRDSLQTRHTVLRNFPVIGHGRYFMEMVRPEIQQYFVESNLDAFPIEREFRSLVYRRAKGVRDTSPFGTQRDVYRIGYEWASHAIAAKPARQQAPRINIGGPDCTQPYAAALLNISAMSYGALSKNAIRALNGGAKLGDFAHNTGEGGVSPYHLEPGGDLIWQIGTGYFGCRTAQGGFDPQRFAEQAAHPAIKMIEIKLSQGAKPGHGGVLPGIKVSDEIARIRGVEAGKTLISPPSHRAFDSPTGLLQFVAELRRLSEGKPVGFKLCIGRRSDFLAICKAMLETGITPDFITVDGGEGGTGAAPLEFANSLGMPSRDAWVFVHQALVGTGLRSNIKLIVSGKVLTAFHMVRAMALGADLCLSARGMMLALGCIQSLRCNTNHCPTGVATQDPALMHGLVVSDKTARVASFQKITLTAFLELLGAMGLEHPRELGPHHIFRRVDDLRTRSLDELYPALAPKQLLSRDKVPHNWQKDWTAAQADQWPQ